ncbi:type I-E CRISPR-associated protein Cas5/CasD [Lacticaseibacillus thailandensis]|uniref:CRISPR-associated protein n=1 Tax=Lacticaseibacillus thailandensis DSM 22698 = JCM 13996 TaxID=1423810 RepID=A0A0R2C8B7_9LACO|nr:type I-E CRISPR-associated protein Cas5/CasD [Lacticaseibacillus thailandensis]KRM87626.1 CRISPR-associated protein [Lacticaseibacillus thailandensis DSM 22698 = JCM 13996]
MKTLTINLRGPLQSYGDEAAFTRRTSTDYPRKSAIVGLLAAALGYHRDDARINELNKVRFAVRVDQPGEPLTDLHTVEWKRNSRKLTYRTYLQDAVFVVAVSADDQLIDRLEHALHHPKFQLYLGRKANVPAGVLTTHQYDEGNPLTVLQGLEWQAAAWYQLRKQRQRQIRLDIIADAGLIEGQREWMVADNVESFDQRHRSFNFRAVKQTAVEVDNPYYQDRGTETSHDAFGALG